MKHKNHLFILFLTIFINLMGFAIILPLSPALLDFYLPAQEQAGGLLGHFIKTAKTLANSLGKENPTFTTAVFFGCILASIYAFLQFLSSPIWGKISDYYGRKNILLITLAGTALSYILWIFSDTFNLFILSRIGAGIMAGNISVATAAVADITTKSDRTKGMALVGIAFGLGFLFGPAMGGLLTKINLLQYFPNSQKWGINPFSACAIVATTLAITNFFFTFFKFEETLPSHKRDKKTASNPRLFDTLRSQSSEIFKTNLSYFIFILSFSGLEFTLAFLAAERFDYSPVHLGYLFLYIGFVLIFTQGYIIRKLSTIVEERLLAISGVFFGIFSFSIIAFAFQQITFIIGSTFLALAIGLSSPSLSSLVSLYASERTQGRFIGLFRSAGSLARAFGPLIASIPYVYLGAKGAYISVSSLLLIPLTLIFFLPKPNKMDPDLLQDPKIFDQEETSAL